MPKENESVIQEPLDVMFYQVLLGVDRQLYAVSYSNVLSEGWVEVDEAIYSLVKDNPSLFKLNDENAAEAYTPPVDLNALKADTLNAVDRIHATTLRDLTGDATIEERDTWQSKELAARALKDGSATNAQIEMLTIEANYLGVAPTELAETIIGKADLFKKLTGLAAGVRGKARAAIKVATTPEQLEAAITQAETDVQAALDLFASG